jgi:general secretion pathway protein K
MRRAVGFDAENAESGIALITVLCVLVLLSLIAAAISFEARVEAHGSRNIVDIASARAAADAGVQRAILDLSNPHSAFDEGKIPADGTEYTWTFADNTVRISIQDEASKLNLNQASPAILVGLFISVGVRPATAQSLGVAIADYRDTDRLRRVLGAEDDDYKAAGLPWGPKNALFQEVDELQQVLGMTPQIYEHVAPYLTVYSVGGGIDPSLAGEQLTGILRRAGFKHFINTPEFAYSIRSVARGVHGAVFVREAVVEVNRDAGRAHILYWQQGVLKS